MSVIIELLQVKSVSIKFHGWIPSLFIQFPYFRPLERKLVVILRIMGAGQSRILGDRAQFVFITRQWAVQISLINYLLIMIIVNEHASGNLEFMFAFLGRQSQMLIFCIGIWIKKIGKMSRYSNSIKNALQNGLKINKHLEATYNNLNQSQKMIYWLKISRYGHR